MNSYQEPKYQTKGDQIINRQSGDAIPEDEPIFILRARDRHAAGLLRLYATLCQDPVHQDAVFVRALQFHNWALSHPDRVREPNTSKDRGWTSQGIMPPPTSTK